MHRFLLIAGALVALLPLSRGQDRAGALERLADLERRVAALEELHAAPPDVPDERPDPPAGTWPTVAGAKYVIRYAGGAEHVLELAAPETWTDEAGWRWAEQRGRAGPLMVVRHVEQWAGVDATRHTWSLVNGFRDLGWVDFERVDGPGYAFGGLLTIQPRGVLSKRYVEGPDRARVVAWEHIPIPAGYPAWVGSTCEQGIGWELEGRRVAGPYALGDAADGSHHVEGDGSLNGSHGGWLVGPWDMGPEGWQRGAPAGWRWAEMRAAGQLARSPLALYGDDLRPVNPHVPYWTGATDAHEPQGWDRGAPNLQRTPWAAELVRHRKTDYSHLPRLEAPFTMLARYDAWARWVAVELIWHDATCWLDGAPHPYFLLSPLDQVVNETPRAQGWPNAGRGLAHTLRLFARVEPYLAARGLERRDSDGRLWRDVLREFCQHVTRPNGTAHSAPSEIGIPYPVVRAREADFYGLALEALDLEPQAAAWRATMAPVDGLGSVAESFWGFARRWNAGPFGAPQGGGFGVPSYYPPYDAIRGDFGWLGEQTLAEALAKPDGPPQEQRVLQVVAPSVLGIVD